MIARKSFPIYAFLILICSLVFFLPSSNAYDRYYNGPFGNCAYCHGNFYNNLHTLHQGGQDPITTNCALCHTQPIGSADNPLIMWSAVDNGNGLGCSGCHGRDYGETITANYGGFPTLGKPKASGYGLRKHHTNAGVIECLACHADVPQSSIHPEWVNPPYYLRSDVHVGGEKCYACDQEDTANDANNRGLDNDGDLDYDADDSDCSLTFDTHIIENTPGGTVQFYLDAGPAFASRTYVVLASVTGIDPGTPLPGGAATLPLNWDFFTDLLLQIALSGSPITTNFLGALDANGESTASLFIPPGPGAVGTEINFAFCLRWPWEFASNPNPIEIVP